jgi:hypothetical protein
LSSTNSDRLHCERQYVIRTGTHQRLNLYVLTPKNKTEQKRIEREIKKTGTYKADYTIAEQETGLSPIVETELELGPSVLWENTPRARARGTQRGSQVRSVVRFVVWRRGKGLFPIEH